MRQYQDVFKNGQLENKFNPYPYFSVPVLSEGDSHVSAWGPMTPFLTGVSIFNDQSHSNCDPVILVGGYNYLDTAGLKAQPSEPSAGVVLETNYLVPSTYYRQMEWYLSFRTTAGNPGIEYRPLTFDYAPDSGQLTGASLSAASQAYGANLDFRAPIGPNSGTRFAQIGWSNAGGGNICGFQHLGSMTEDTLIDVQAQGARNSAIQLGSSGLSGVARWATLSYAQCSFSVGAATNFLRLYDTSSNMAGAVAINTSTNASRAGLIVSTSAGTLPSIVARGVSGQTAPLLRLVDSTNSDPATSTGEVFSIDTNGRTYTKVGSLPAGTAQGAAVMNSAFSDITGGTTSRGVTLPSAVKGMVVRGYVNGTSSTNLWPASGATINGATANTPLMIPARKMFTAVAITTTAWAVQVGS